MTTKTTDIDELFARVTPISDAVNEAAREALLHHKLVGNPVASWENGQVVIIPPEKIIVPKASQPAGEQDAA